MGEGSETYFGGEVGRYVCQNDGLDEDDTIVKEGEREGRREGRRGGREGEKEESRGTSMSRATAR